MTRHEQQTTDDREHWEAEREEHTAALLRQMEAGIAAIRLSSAPPCSRLVRHGVPLDIPWERKPAAWLRCRRTRSIMRGDRR